MKKNISNGIEGDRWILKPDGFPVVQTDEISRNGDYVDFPFKTNSAQFELYCSKGKITFSFEGTVTGVAHVHYTARPENPINVAQAKEKLRQLEENRRKIEQELKEHTITSSDPCESDSTMVHTQPESGGPNQMST